MQRNQNLTPTESSPASNSKERKGSILVIVIALLGMLLLLGMAFYTFASQEHLSSTYFSESTKIPADTPADVFFDYGLEQLIVGPAETQKQSALYGRTHSLVGNMLGINANTVSGGFFDPIPYNGQGVNLIANATTGGQSVDQDYDGNPDAVGPSTPAGQDPLNTLNLSAAANGGTEINPFTANRPQPDVGYTYPDINNLFLAHISEPTEDVNGRRVIIPSFLRPQILRYPDGHVDDPLTVGVDETEGKPILNWHLNDGVTLFNGATVPDPSVNTTRMVLRPHPAHLIAGTSTHRYIRSSTANPLAYGNPPTPDAPVTNVLGNEVEPFPFATSGGSGRMGVWTGNSDTEYDFDADNDNDGTNEGIWLDLGFPAQTLIDGRRYVPLFSFTVQDADGLINLNTAGNLNEHFVGTGNYGDASSPDMQNIPISTSHLGASRTEVNPQWALWDWTSGNLTADQQKEFKYFPNLTGTMSRTAIANMELIHIKNGQKRDDGTGGDEYNVGAWGELSVLQTPNGFASPGQPGADDDGDENSGTDLGTPLDLRGFGSIIGPNLPDGSPSANGLVANLVVGPSADPNRWPQFDSFLTGSTLPVSLTPNPLDVFTQEDEADETVVEPLLSDSAGSIGNTIEADSIYSADEMLGLHLTNSEFTSVAGTSRLRKLAPINFAGEAVRKQFTTTSFDRAEFSWPINHARPWEQNLTTGELFPYANDPFRVPLGDLLSMRHRFRLNINRRLTQVNADGRPVYQSLTPYSTSEAQANSDRIELARDIYTLLYSVGGGVDQDYSQSTLATPYTPAQLEEMAQFAVNIVDALDTDNVITIFEYDENLGDGWATSGRKVYGVEAQELTLSEALVIRTVPPVSMMDDPKTTFDDSDTNSKYYTFLELRNVSPYSLRLGETNGQLGAWRIRVVNQPNGDTDVVGTSPQSQRFLYLIPDNNAVAPNTGGPIPAGGQLTIGSRSGSDLDTSTDPDSERPSDFRVDYDNDGDIETIAPKSAEATVLTGGPVYAEPGTVGCDLDLVIHSSSYTTPPPAPRFKLIKDNGMVGGQEITPGGSDALVDSSITSSEVGFVLERLANPGKVALGYEDPGESNNPWIPIDRMTVTIQTFDVGAEADSTGLSQKKSWERGEPLDSGTEGLFNDTAMPAPTIANSLGQTKNFRSPAQFTNWQPHFDRDFTSTLELLSIPLYGTRPLALNDTPLTVVDKVTLESTTPNRLKRSQDMTKSAHSELAAVTDTNIASVLDDYKGLELIAAKKFLRPDYDDAIDSAQAFDNRWYRLLDLVDVSTQSNHLVQWDQNSNGIDGTQWENIDLPPRLPGAINLNTIRHRGVLASLIDDPNFHLNSGYASLSAMLSDPNESRDWWVETIGSRDLVDPVTSLMLPGLPGSRPFRSGGFLDRVIETDSNGNTIADPGEDTNGNGTFEIATPGVALQQTLLRDLAIDGTTIRRNLFEARTSGAATEVDYHTRHRLLRKIANNSTNRSNVFIVWMTVGFFEAVDDATSGGVRIGAKLTALPEHRGFFIVDRTLLEEAEIEDSTNGVRFDYKKFILYRKTLK